MNLQALHKAVSAVCPLDGITTPDLSDKSTWHVDFGSGATAPQIAAAEAIIAGASVTETQSHSPAGQRPPTMIASALDVTIDVLGNVLGASTGVFGFAGAVRLGVGLYGMQFSEIQPDTDYFPDISNGAPMMRVTVKMTDYFLIQALDADSDPLDPPGFCVKVFRP